MNINIPGLCVGAVVEVDDSIGLYRGVVMDLRPAKISIYNKYCNPSSLVQYYVDIMFIGDNGPYTTTLRDVDFKCSMKLTIIG